VRQGILVRRSRWRKEWHERYFVLKNGRLQCKVRESESSIKDEQSFEGTQVMLEMRGRDVYEYDFPYRFDITVGKARRSYRCASEQDYLEWTSSVAKAAKPHAKLFTQVDVRLSCSRTTMPLDVTVAIPSSRLESHNGVSSLYCGATLSLTNAVSFFRGRPM
jgi:hypothetical protein